MCHTATAEVNNMENENIFLTFILTIVKKGVTSVTYKERAEIILNNLNPEINSVYYDMTLVFCNMTMSTIIKNYAKIYRLE